MSKIRKHPKEHTWRKQIAQRMGRRLTLLIAFLVAVLLGLIFSVGEAWWPVWLLAHRTQVGGIILFSVICLILLSPVIIEADSNPRPLSGPGKNPEGPRLE